MFHTWPVKIISTQASSSPALECGKSATMPSTRPGRKPSTGMPWQDVEYGDHDPLGDTVVRGDAPVDEGEDERQHVGGDAARERQQGVPRQRPQREVDVDRRPQRRRPAARQGDNPGDECREADEDQRVDPPGARRGPQRGGGRAGAVVGDRHASPVVVLATSD